MSTAARRRSGQHGLLPQGFTGFTPVILFLILLLFVSIHTHNLASLTTDCGVGSESRIHQLSPLSNSVNLADACDTEYKRVTRGRTPGITKDDLARSQAHLGNRFRLVEVMKLLTARKRPVSIVVAGGSISLGHGVTPDSARYADRLESWMNQEYMLESSEGHRVLNVAAHGADMCAMAKRLNVLYSDLSSKLPQSSKGDPDLIILEFAVNDYQGQDHLITVDSKTSVFFDGFKDLVLCAEVVTHALLKRYPNSAIVFLEFQTAIATRKTGALLHMGVAQHYDVPVISYAATMFPGFYRLKAELEKMDDKSYTFPQDRWLANGGLDQPSINVTSGVFSYPHGCSRCEAQHIIEQFRYGGCKSICTFVERSGIIHGSKLKCSSKQGHIPEGRNECFVPFLAHDAIHPSAIGHAIASDLVVHTLASAERSACNSESAPSRDILPLTTFVADSAQELDTRANFLVVNDVARIFSRWDKLTPIASSVHGFRLYADDELKQRPGWIATSPEGSSSITFALDLPPGECYTVYLAILRSYKGMGTFTVQVRDFGANRKGQPKRVTTKDNIDGLWSSPISDIQITPDDENGCTGFCEVQITTDRKKEDREGNKVKLLTLSARSCWKIHSW